MIASNTFEGCLNNNNRFGKIIITVLFEPGPRNSQPVTCNPLRKIKNLVQLNLKPYTKPIIQYPAGQRLGILFPKDR